MKKLLAFFSIAYVFLFVTVPVFAQEQVQLCPEGDPTFGNLCTADWTFNNILRNIIILLLVIAVVMALIYLIWGGIKWIMSGGDKAKVDEARKSIVGAIIGLAVAFAAFFILNIVAQIFLNQSLTTLGLPEL